MTIFKFSEISRLLTGDRTAIRRNYSRDGKYKEAINELKEFEKRWKTKYSNIIKQ